MLLTRIKEKVAIILRFLRFSSRAKSIDLIDSPLLFDLCKILRDKYIDPTEQSTIENRRTELINDRSIIQRQSLGAVSKMNPHEKISISQLAQSSVSPRYKCELLTGLVKWTRARRVLELGTSLAISSSYMATIDDVVTIDTVEGSSSIGTINAQVTLNSKITCHIDSFTSFITHQKERHTKYDCILLDGHHQYESTIEYVDECMDLLNPGGYLILDDIYWSSGMMDAWQVIKCRSDYNLSIDVFFYGILSKQTILKEAIDIKLWPFRSRWQVGLFR